MVKPPSPLTYFVYFIEEHQEVYCFVRWTIDVFMHLMTVEPVP